MVDPLSPYKKIRRVQNYVIMGSFRESKQDRPKRDNPITHWMRSYKYPKFVL